MRMRWMRVGVELLLLLLRVPRSIFRLLLFSLALHHGPLVVCNAYMAHTHAPRYARQRHGAKASGEHWVRP